MLAGSLGRFRIRELKGLAKLGNIVAGTMSLVMFPGVAKLRNICFGRKIYVWEAKMFMTPEKNIFCFPSSKICFRNTFPAPLNWETIASATTFPSLLDSEDGFHTGCQNISCKQQSFSGLQLPRWSFSIKSQHTVKQNGLCAALFHTKVFDFQFLCVWHSLS